MGAEGHSLQLVHNLSAIVHTCDLWATGGAFIRSWCWDPISSDHHLRKSLSPNWETPTTVHTNSNAGLDHRSVRNSEVFFELWSDLSAGSEKKALADKSITSTQSFLDAFLPANFVPLSSRAARGAKRTLFLLVLPTLPYNKIVAHMLRRLLSEERKCM